MRQPETTPVPANVVAASWRPALGAFTIVTVGFIALYWTTGFSLVATWARTGMFRYAFLIFPISAWLIWSKRHELVAWHEPATCLWALPLLIGTVFAWFLGAIANVDVVQHAAFVATFPVLVLLFFGADVVRVLLFPLVYLVFAIPVGHSAVEPLQHITAVMSVHFLQWTGVPVLLQGGHHILTPSTAWKVAEACSGIRFFTACTAIGSLFAYVFFTSYWRRSVFIFASMIVPIVANGLRVYFTILIGETFGLKYAQGTDHLVFGWQFFGAVLFLLLLVGWFLREPLPEEPDTNVETRHTNRGGWKHWLPVAVAAAVVMGAAPAWAAAMRASVSIPATPALTVVPDAGDWARQNDLSKYEWKPDFAGADWTLGGVYSRAGHNVSLFAAAYRGAQVNGHDLLAYGNAIFDADRWRAVGGRNRTIELADGNSLIAHEVVLHGPFTNRLVWYWYGVNGGRLTSPVQVRLRQAWDELRGAKLYSSIIAVSIGYQRGQRQIAAAVLDNFVRAAEPRVERKLAAAASAGGAGR
ncbi:MAG TPA: exosortase A [Gammaproteobacteria bacterium]|nr:exosortase A [Gammaproteobacteria bacterium]